MSKITPNLRGDFWHDFRRLGVIFDMISIKAHWERWCRWNCDLRVINAQKKGIFYRTESVAMMPKSHDHIAYYVTLGSRCKMANSSSKNETDTLPETVRDPQGYSRISLSLSGRILKEYRNIMSASKQTPCGIPWGLWNRTNWSACYTNGVMWHSKKVSSFDLYKLNPLSPHCGSIAQELVHCYTWGRLRIVTDGHFAYLKTLDFNDVSLTYS